MPGPLILNVDDYAPGRYARSKILTRAGFTVREAASGAEALELLHHKPDLILLDVNLPDVNGFDLCRKIKADPDTAGIIIVHLSASHTGPADRALGLNNGADSYLTEPIEPEVLVATARAMLRARSAEEALRRSNQDLRDLTYMLSHEMREAVRSVTVYSELLQRKLAGRLAEEEQELMSHTLSGARRMTTLIDGVLMFSQTLHDGLHTSDISSREALDGAMAELELMLKESGAQIVCGPMPRVRANLVGLTRVFSNLLSNSIKYHNTNPPVVHISATSEAGVATFSLADNGMGISPEYHASIFEPFKRLHGRELAGVGIGLSLCRRMIEAQGGRIWVESEPGKGATFFFTLPVDSGQSS